MKRDVDILKIFTQMSFCLRHDLSVGAKRFRCAGVLVQPRLIYQCDVDICKNLYANVVLSGGTTIFQGIGERVTNELTALAPSTMRSRWLLRFGIDWRSFLVNELPDGNIITVTPNISVAWEYVPVKFH